MNSFLGVSLMMLKAMLLNHSGFREGVLPFLYLGLVLCFRSLTKDVCNALLDKISGNFFH